MTRRRPGFTILETCIALALLILAGTLVAELAVFSLRERARADIRLAAIEWAANVLEAAQALPAAELTPAWAAERQLPADLRDRLGGGTATVEVGSEKGIVGVKRVTVTVRWTASADRVEAPVVLTALFRAEGAP
jgi:Tfp pilus assembly protein PilV